MARFYRRTEAARYLHETFGVPCSTGTLANYAAHGKGPAFSLVGRFPIYSETELDLWAKNRIRPVAIKAPRQHADALASPFLGASPKA